MCHKSGRKINTSYLLTKHSSLLHSRNISNNSLDHLNVPHGDPLVSLRYSNFAPHVKKQSSTPCEDTVCGEIMIIQW